jgi:N utilization substance protein B
MSARGKARKRALDVLFSADIRGVPPLEVLAEGPIAAGAAPAQQPQNPYVRTIVEGVVAHRARIDELISTYSSGWAVDRMPVVDRNVLRIAVFELLWGEGVPAAVVIDEAVGLARQLSTDDSPGFVNGLLSRILDVRDRLAV